MRILLSVFFLLTIAAASAQQTEYSSANNSAIRVFEQALRFYDSRLNEKAIDALNTTIEKDPNFIEAYLLRANIFEDRNNHIKSIADYKKVISINPDFFPNTYYSLGKVEMRMAKYEEAKSDLQKYITHAKATKELIESANRLLANCNFAIDAMQHPVEFHPVNMGDSINSVEEEYLPTITADGKTFLFTRRTRMKNQFNRNDRFEDFFISHLVNKNWTKAKSLIELNTSGNEGAGAFSADGQYLFFTGCEEFYGANDERAKGIGDCDIYISKKAGDKFQTPRNLGEPVNSKGYETQPSFSSDGRTLYFVRKVKSANGKTHHDIFISFINDKAQWSEPLPLPDNINTSAEEMTVFIHPDDQTLYFSSSGHPGMGGLDIFLSRRQPDGAWGIPVNLGFPINTSGDEINLLVSPDGTKGYFSSDKDSGIGQLDLYQFDLAPALRPEKITYMKGKVFDADTKKPLGANFELIDIATAKIIVRSNSDAESGEFIVCLPVGKTYALNVSRDGYLFYSDNFELKDPKSVREPVLKDVPLAPIKVGASVVLKNIFYETDKYNLKDESKAELNKLIQFMNKNSKIKMEVSGHTDNTGTKPHNQTLSENRAKAVIDYLIKSGISNLRLSFKGYADNKPIADNKTEAGKAKNRRTEFLVTEVN